MNIVIVVIIAIVALLAGTALGVWISQRQTKKILMENPPLNEDAVRMMMSSMGRKPSETQVQQVLRQIRQSAKQAEKKKK
ncbi:YneF family protein [Lactococcus termiticola]|uniref:UPF0154 protein NtB2_01328 n=1 Tax=Lactococcus termiticola TaxID=2169526 RepID=A0A2R5HK81_9LACT|nr:YneF family protein [Lactococcus termiticola]GBG97190.1 hypothetical protein NtB2_01328 [Lactococcus termiticola]